MEQVVFFSCLCIEILNKTVVQADVNKLNLALTCTQSVKLL
jgi:hypothetical protein